MTAPETSKRLVNIISECVYCGHSFTVGDNARCVESAVRRFPAQSGQFVHLHCLGTWTTLKAMERQQARARIRVVG